MISYPSPDPLVQERIMKASQYWPLESLKTIVNNQSAFVTGTDTEIGKSFVSASLLFALRSHGYSSMAMKPIASGAQFMDDQWINEDSQIHLWACSQQNVIPQLVNPYAFAPPIAPHIAAEQAGIKLCPQHISTQFSYLKQQYPREFYLVEGAGGLLVPLDYNTTNTMADIAIHLQIPVLWVVGVRLGAINHAFLTDAYLKQLQIPTIGWVANMIDPALLESLDLWHSQLTTLQNRLGKPLATLPYIQ